MERASGRRRGGSFRLHSFSQIVQLNKLNKLKQQESSQTNKSITSLHFYLLSFKQFPVQSPSQIVTSTITKPNCQTDSWFNCQLLAILATDLHSTQLPGTQLLNCLLPCQQLVFVGFSPIMHFSFLYIMQVNIQSAILFFHSSSQ